MAAATTSCQSGNLNAQSGFVNITDVGIAQRGQPRSIITRLTLTDDG